MSDRSDTRHVVSRSAHGGGRTHRGMAGRKESRGHSQPVLRKEKRATYSETARRVDVIVGLMQRDEWRCRTTAEALAAEWKVAPATVEALAAEASRRVAFIASLASNPEKLKTDVAQVLVRSLHAAYERGAHGDVARVGDIVTKITGARAPEQHKVDMTVRQYEDLPPVAMLARIRDQRAKLDEAERRLLEEHPELGEQVLTLPATNEQERP